MQFGGALHRVLRRVRHADPKFGPVYLTKHDIKDGFYRMFLKADDCTRLAIILPKYDGEPQLIAVPMAATMGWTQSPPVFSVMSETVADVTNRNFESLPRTVIPHRLEEPASRLDDLSPDPLPRGEEDTTATQRLQALHSESLLTLRSLQRVPRPIRCTLVLWATRTCLSTTSSNWGKAAPDASRPSGDTCSAPSTKCLPDRPQTRPTGTRPYRSRSS
jgi:hypothetical protein